MGRTKTTLALAFKAVGLAMGASIIAINTVKAADMDTYLALIGVGLFALGIAGIIEHRVKQ